PEVVDGDDVGMIESRGRAGLLFEALQTRGVRGHFRRQDLDRNFPRQAHVTSPVNLPHAPRAERSEDLVGTESSADGERHGTDLRDSGELAGGGSDVHEVPPGLGGTGSPTPAGPRGTKPAWRPLPAAHKAADRADPVG